MKIIQVVGRSNTGKTTLIRQLVPLLAVRGRVGVIKHLGDHLFTLEEGRDTTEFFSAGASISVGIDVEKSVATFRTNSLDDILALLDHNGMDFAIIEGFKTRMFPRIVLGDLETKNCILRNPELSDIIANLDRFQTYAKPKAYREAL